MTRRWTRLSCPTRERTLVRCEPFVFPSLNSPSETFQSTSILSDGELVRSALDPSLFPGIPDGVSVHDGFADAQADTASDVLDAVNQGLSTYGTNTITVTGHSLGAAISLIDTVYLYLNLDPSISISFIGWGLPRVGNQDWADYLDSTQTVTHINNKVRFWSNFGCM